MHCKLSSEFGTRYHKTGCLPCLFSALIPCYNQMVWQQFHTNYLKIAEKDCSFALCKVRTLPRMKARTRCAGESLPGNQPRLYDQGFTKLTSSLVCLTGRPSLQPVSQHFHFSGTETRCSGVAPGQSSVRYDPRRAVWRPTIFRRRSDVLRLITGTQCADDRASPGGPFRDKNKELQ